MHIPELIFILKNKFTNKFPISFSDMRNVAICLHIDQESYVSGVPFLKKTYDCS